MNAKRRCPECNQNLITEVMDCSCGWRAGQSEQMPADHRCQYQVRGRRCPLPGTISPSIRGNGPWYCSEHWRNLGEAQLGEAILINAEKNYESILEERIDWRRKLFADEFKITKAMIRKKETT